VGEVTQGLQDTAGQAVDQVGQTAEGLAPATQGATEQAQGALGQATDQVGQAAQGVQGSAEQTTQQAQGVAEQATTQQNGGEQGETAAPQQTQATSGASQKAEELGVDLSEVEGTGPNGRITLKDVKGAADQR
jgi:pyruvate dehydrogenase E2 component (dihydrolipoamide acetyltransferase)